jgi:hypothetical protein
MAVHFNPSVPAYFVNAGSPAEAETVLFSLENSIDELLHLAVFDYEEWVDSDGNDEEALFSIDRSEDNMFEAAETLPRVASGLYLIQAYFENGKNFDAIVKKLDESREIKIKCYADGTSLVFDTCNTFQVLTFEEADRILNEMEN